jgi:hypothetical protein
MRIKGNAVKRKKERSFVGEAILISTVSPPSLHTSFSIWQAEGSVAVH